MRIALVIYGSLEQISGGFIYDRALVNALAARGHRIDVISLPWHAYGRAVAGGWLGGAVDKVRGGRRAAHRRIALGAAPCDVVIEDELVHPSIVARGRTPRGGGTPIRVALVHNLRSGQPGEPLRALKAAVERRYLAGVEGVIAVCARTRDDVGALAGARAPSLIARPGRDHVAPGVDGALAAARAAEPGPLRVLHAAAVQPHKGLARLLAALARAAAQRDLDFTLDVVGANPAGRYRRAIERQIAALAIGARVRFHGELRGPPLRAIFRGSQLFALPSDREAYSLACLEALGYGLPVLATSAGGLSEMITDGEQGFLLDPADVERWSDHLAALGADRPRLSRLSIAALARYQAHPRWSEVAAAVEVFLESLLPQRGRQPAQGLPSP